MNCLARFTSVALILIICAVLSLALVAPCGSFVLPKVAAAPEVKASAAIKKGGLQGQLSPYIFGESTSRAWLWPISSRAYETALMQSTGEIAFRASANANNGTGAISITIITPAGTASGDMMVAGIYVRGHGSTATATPPLGWTLIRRTDLGSPTGALGSVLSYYKVAGGAEPSNYTWTFDTSRRALGGIASYAGVDTAAPIVSGGQENSTGSTAVTAPSITTTVANTMLVGLFCQFDFASFTPAAGMTERWDMTVNNPAGMAFSATDEARASVGATGGRTATSSFSDTSVAQLIALRPGNVTPNTPSNLTAAAGNAQVSLSWTASSGAASYKVFRGTSPGGYNYNVPLASGITSTSHTDTTALNGTTYYYVVRATNGVGDSASSNEVSATPSNSAFNVKINFQPASAEVPVGYLADAGAVYGSRGNGYSYGWNADSSAHTRDRNAANSPDQRYDTLNHTQLYGAFTWEIAILSGTYMVRLVSGDPNNIGSVYRFNVENVLTVDGTPTVASPWVEGSRTVTVSDGRLTLSNAAGASNNKVCFIEISSVTPLAPTNLSATAVSSSQINLGWTDNANNEDGFKIERCQGVGCTDFVQVAQVGANVAIYNDTGRTDNTTYLYRVRAFNSSGDSGYSNIAQGTTPAVPVPPAAPSNLTASAISSSQINMAWADNSNNENGFNIERKTGATGTYAEIATTAANTFSYSDTTASASTAYYYRVRAFNGIGASNYSAEANATTPAPPPPAAPGNLVATAASTTQINLAWADNSGNESGFKVERCQGAGCANFTEITQAGVGVTTYSDMGLAAATTYGYRVRAFNGGGDSSYSNISAATTAATPPAAPSNLTATAASTSQINLAWTDNGNNEDGFRIERCQDVGCTTFAQIGQVGAGVTTYSDTGRTENTTYLYRVRAFNSGGDSGNSNTAQATTPLPPPPATPGTLAATAVSISQINLSWTDNSTDESGFKIEGCQGAGCTNFAQIAQVGAGVTSFSNTGLVSSTTYAYRVRAFNNGGDSPYSNTAEATTLAPPPPAAPSNLTATAASASQINLTWTDNSNNESGFKVERCTGASCTDFAEITQTGENATGYNDTGRAASTTYRYRVRAFNGSGSSAFSNTNDATTFATPPAAPGNLAATAASSSQINLTWTDNANNESGFKIERCQGATCTDFAQVGQVNADTTAYSDTGRTASTTYRYRVRAFNSAGDSGYSSIVEATTPAPPPPAAPSNLAAAAASSSQINLTWTDNSNNENNFKVERCLGAACIDFAEIAQTSENITSYSDTGRTASTTYGYRVRAFNSGGGSNYSNISEAATLATPPAAPGNLAATPASATQINLAWADNSGDESGFKVERCQGATCTNFTEITQVGAGTTAYSDAGRTAATTYTYRVRAFNSGGDSGYSNTAAATTPAIPPAAPSDLTATAASATQINLSWTDNASNEDGFKIEHCQGAGCTTFTQIAQVGANVVTYNDTGKTAETTYLYRVRAFNSGGDSGYSTTAQATTTPPAPPAAPSNLSATAVSISQINLSWTDNSTDESGFKIERCQGTGCTTFAQIGQVGAGVSSFNNTELVSSTTYAYRVRAFNNGGDSAYSNTSAATTLVTPPAAPSGLVATATSASQISLTWTDNASNEDGFKVDRCQGTGCTTFTQIGQVGAGVTSFGNTGLAASSIYIYRVRAFNSGGDSGYSNTAEATTQAAPAPPSAPSNLVATAASSSQINLAWADNSNNEDGFRVERKTGTAGTYVEIGTVTTGVIIYQDTTGLAAGTQYFYRVRAYNAAGNSGYSNEASAMTADTAPASPSGLTGSAVSSSQVNLAWADNSTNETGFKIERKTGGAGTFAQIATVGSNGTTYSDTGLSATTQYVYRVRAYNTVGDSGYSNEANATTTGNAPTAPTGLSASAGNAEVTLSWMASSGATSYNIKRATVSGGPYTTIASGIATTSYTDTTVSNGTTYHYVVSAVNSFGESGNSTQASATPGISPLGGIGFRASVNASNGGGATTITINKPTGVVSGDCMVAALWVRGNSAYGTITPPSGWSLIRNENWAGIDAIITYYKLAGASEPANYTWAFSTSEQLQGGIAAYYNVDQSVPVNVSAGSQAIYTETNIPAPSVTPTVSNTLLLCFFGSYSPGSFTPPSGMSERWDLSNSTTNNSFSAADEIYAGPNATGTRTATHAGTPNYWITQTVALKPAPVSCMAGNCPPNTPTITAPFTDGTIVHPADVHMETLPNFSDPNPGDSHVCTDWEIWTVSSPERVWVASCVDGPHRYHTHIGDGIFENSHAGRNDFLHDTNYRLRARFKDSSGDLGTQWSAWAERRFRTASLPPAPSGTTTWSVMQPGYQVEVFATGLELPVNIAFVPNPGPQPTDPYLYVTELYSGIKVVRRNGTVTDYLRNLLNYIPSGQFPGDGEQGVTGIVVDPVSRDVFVSLLYDVNGVRHPIVVRLFSDASGTVATGFTVILDMVGETQYASHQISNLSIGPDGKLYVHNGDGFEVSTGQNLDSFRGKILRMNLNGSAPSDNPFYNASDGITARDYVFAYGFRNAFGGDWRKADNFHYAVENGPSVDRFAKIVLGRNYLWDGSDASMYNYAIYNWSPATAPVNLAFIQPGTFGGSGFPADKMGHAFVSESGPTWATGPVGIYGKRISEFALDASGNLVSGPTTLIEYSGNGKATVSGLAAGPDGLYFTDLYVDQSFATAVARGANILRVKYVGAIPVAPTGLTATAGNAQVSLSWTASSGAASYNVKRATVSGGPFTTIASGVSATSYTDTGVTNGTTYYYVVSAANTFGESANSTQVSAAPSAVPPAGIAFRASASASNGGGATTLTINKPLGVVSGDCMVAALWVRGNSAYGTINPPSGWSLIRNENWAGIDAIITYYKLASASEPANYTWTFSTSEQLQGGIAAYYNVDQSAPLNVSAGAQSISPATSIPAPSVSPTVSNTLLLCFFGSYSPGSFTPPSGMAERWDLSNAFTNNSFSAADQIHAGTNATGTRTATHAGASAHWITQTIALKPAP